MDSNKSKKGFLGAKKIPMSVSPKEDKPESNYLEIFCPYCESKNFVKRGTRQKKLGKVQLYKCNDCGRTFTPGAVKGKHYPMVVIIDAMSLYYLGYSLEYSAKTASEIYRKNKQIECPAPEVELASGGEGQKGQKGQKDLLQKDNGNIGSGTFALQPSSLLNWIKQYKSICPFFRMRPYAIKMFKPADMISSATLAHRQLYRFRHHRAKTQLILKDDIKHGRFWPLKEFLDLVPAECPHQYFQKGLRASEAPMVFSKTEMIVRGKHNYANKLAKFAIESASQAKDRHDILQRFMLANDTVTVATEVPVYIRREDLAHMQTQLGFEMYKKQTKKQKMKKQEFKPFTVEELPCLITGHIDFIQIRNGFIHILDYKPKAAKEKPIEQLTIYALAMSRLTGLRVFHFKCAWFDEEDYFEFFPLHVVRKPKKRRKRRKITTIEGIYHLNDSQERIDKIRAN